MSLLHNLSKPSLRNEIDLFSIPPTDTSVDYSMYAEYHPLVNVADSSSNIEFKITGNGNHYLDLSDNFIYLKVKVLNKDGKDLDADSKIGTTNFFLHALFSQLDVYFNSNIVSTSNNAYPYRAYMETLLSYGNDYKNSQGTCALFYSDTDEGEANSKNLGYVKRKEFITGSKPIELIDKLRFDLATQHRYLLNDVGVSICLTRSSDAFSLLTEAADISGIVKILHASLFVRKQILYPSIILSHQKLLEKGEVARYPYKKSEIKHFTISNGSSSAIEENLFSGSIPNRIIIGFVPSASFIGQFHKNPFKFNHNNLSNIALTINNVSIPIRPLSFNFNSNEFLLAYYMLFTSTGTAGQDIGLTFDRENYKNNNCFYIFDVFQNKSSYLSLEKSGNIKLEIIFSAPLPEALHCIVFSEHQAVAEIDKFRQVIVT